MRRPTIRDIAREAGVSSGAVSFALNGRPGVSDATRARVLQVAADLGWTPSVAAKALSRSRAHALGLVIARPASSMATEGFFLRLIAGIEEVCTPRATALVLQLVDDQAQELATHRRWWAERRVDGVVLTDPVARDPRPAELARLGMPGVVVGGVAASEACAAVATDDAGAMAQVVAHLAAQGHQRLAHVAGIPTLLHTQRRCAAFAAAVATAGAVTVPVPSTDFTEDSGQRATAALLALPQPPTAIVYDNELLAVGGLAAIQARRLRVPDDVAVVSWEDSPVCRVLQPPLTALQRDPATLGKDAAQLLLDVLDGGEPAVVTEEVPRLVVRGSTTLLSP